MMVFVLSVLRLSTPVCLASLGGYFSERTGTIHLALEGLMLISAFFSASIAYITGSPYLGILTGVLSSVVLASLHAFFCIELKADQVISGMAINFLALGLTPVLGKAFFDLSGSTPLLANTQTIQAVFGISPILVSLVFLTLAVWFIHHKTRLGQYIRFAGEHPAALETQGVSVRKLRWFGVLSSGFFCGLAGAYLSIDHGSGFTRNMTAGRGFIALAALIIGRWHPIGAVVAALVFGVIESTQILFQGVQFGGQTVPVQWIQMLPYVATLVILVGIRSKRAKPPKNLGQHYQFAS